MSDRLLVCDGQQFLDSILPVPQEVVDQILCSTTTDETYKDGRWCGFPADDTVFAPDESYKPFVKVANTIAATAKRLSKDTDQQVRDAQWVDYHIQRPPFLDAEGADAPDCLLGITSFVKALENNPSLPEDKKEAFFWLQAVAAVEAKHNLDHSDEKLVRRLLGHLRVILVEQKDRRFVLGLALSSTQVSVWLQDRTGVLGMDKPVHIHEEPAKFVQIIAAFAILPAHRLGFDPTMKLSREPASPIHTYRLKATEPDQFNLDSYKKNNYAMQWVIETGNGIYVTLKTVSLPTDRFSASGSIVWAVIPYDERDKCRDEWQIFVLKQAWRLDGKESEGALYDYLQQASGDTSSSEDARYLGEVVHSADVTVDGKLDNTHDLIRCGLQSAPLPDGQSPRLGMKRRRLTSEEEMLEMGHIKIVSASDIRKLQPRRVIVPEKRTRTRITFKVFGCSIQFYTSLSELIQCLLHCVRGHRFAFIHGVLQCDISPANLLIALMCSSERLQPGFVRGCLIDLDHAKRIPKVADRQVAPEVHDTDDLQRLRSISLRLQTVTVTDDVLARALQVTKIDYMVPPRMKADVIVDRAGPTVGYVMAALHYTKKYNTYTDGVCTPESLGWDTRLLGPPHLPTTTPQQAAREPRSGTPPFASAMLLNPDGVSVNAWQSNLRRRSVLHDAIHDIESFFWVLLYLCITRSGPGGDQREDLNDNFREVTDNPEELERIERLRHVVHCFFAGSIGTLAENKKTLFEEETMFETEVLVHIHPYFAPLVPALQQWWDLLQLAYEFQGYEYHDIHNRVIDLLEKALQNLADLESKGSAVTEQAENAKKKREDFVSRVLHAGSDSKIHGPREQQAMIPPTSPTNLRVSAVIAVDNTPESQTQQQPRCVAQMHTNQADSASTLPKPAAKKMRR